MYSRFKWHRIISWGSVGFVNIKYNNSISLFCLVIPSLSLAHRRTFACSVSLILSQLFVNAKLVKSTLAFIFYSLFVKWLQTYVDTRFPICTVSMRLQLNNNINNIVCVCVCFCLFVVTAVATVSVHLLLFITNTLNAAYPFGLTCCGCRCLINECIWSIFGSVRLALFFCTLINDEHRRYSFLLFHSHDCQSSSPQYYEISLSDISSTFMSYIARKSSLKL